MKIKKGERMIRGYLFRSVGILILILLLSGVTIAAGEQSPADLIAQEESGIEMPADLDSAPVSKAPSGQGLVTNTIPQDSVLLIPESLDDNVGMYDPYSGDFLGILIPTDTVHLSTPINAIQGPGDNIYLADQVADAVFVYDTSGAYLYTYCDYADGIDNVRGIDFRNDTLFVSSGNNDLVARFDAPHNRLPDFINDGSEPFDIHFLEDGRALLADIQGTTDNVRLYNADGTFAGQIFSVSFPEQVNYDDLVPGEYLNASFSASVITDFDLDGTIHQTSAWSSGRGVYRLGNGNLLATNGSGVFEIEPGTGSIIEQKNTGSGRFIELFVLESGPPPTGRCCYNDFQDCVDTTEAACTALGGEWDADLNCAGNPCPVEGRCCYNNNQNCVDTTEAVCLDLGGDWDDTLNCIDNPCPTGGCDYVPGDVNGSDSYNGLDITYGVAYFKGGPEPLCAFGTCPIPPCDAFFYCGDVNGSCSYNGLDITYGVAYFKGGPSPLPCPDCPPNP